MHAYIHTYIRTYVHTYVHTKAKTHSKNYTVKKPLPNTYGTRNPQEFGCRAIPNTKPEPETPTWALKHSGSRFRA